MLNWLQAILFLAALTFVSYGASYYLATGRIHDLEYGLSFGVLFVVLGLVIAAIAYVALGEFRLLPIAYRRRVIAMLIGLPTLGCLSVALGSESVRISAATIAEASASVSILYFCFAWLGVNFFVCFSCFVFFKGDDASLLKRISRSDGLSSTELFFCGCFV